MTTAPALELRDASFSYEHAPLLFEGLNVAFEPGTSTSIQGRSGSGKSTLISLLGLLRTPTSGDVVLHGRSTKDIPDHVSSRLRGTSLGFVFQDSHLAPNRAVWKSVAMPLLIQGVSRSSTRQRAIEVLEQVELAGLDNRRPGQLSGGQQQRCAVARALATRPRIVIADEPTGSLDEATADIVAGVLFGLAARGDAAVIVVTHDTSIAGLADVRLTLTAGQLR